MVRFQRYGIVPARCPELSPFLKDNFRLFSFEKPFCWICIVDWKFLPLLVFFFSMRQCCSWRYQNLMPLCTFYRWCCEQNSTTLFLCCYSILTADFPLADCQSSLENHAICVSTYIQSRTSPLVEADADADAESHTNPNPITLSYRPVV